MTLMRTLKYTPSLKVASVVCKYFIVLHWHSVDKALPLTSVKVIFKLSKMSKLKLYSEFR